MRRDEHCAGGRRADQIQAEGRIAEHTESTMTEKKDSEVEQKRGERGKKCRAKKRRDRD